METTIYIVRIGIAQDGAYDYGYYMHKEKAIKKIKEKKIIPLSLVLGLKKAR